MPTKAKAKTERKPPAKVLDKKKRPQRILDSSHSKATNQMVHVPKNLLVQPPQPLSPQPIFRQYSAEQLDIIKQTVAKGTTDDELKWFLIVAKEIGLSPLRRQIHCVKRWSKKDGREVMTIQTGIDGFRSVADSTGTYAPSDKQPLAKYDDHNRLFSVTVWGKKYIPLDRSWHEFSAVALWDEFVPLEVKDGQKEMPFMWQKMPYNQLEKCAEAKMLRRGWPDRFGNVYVNEEMHRADVEAGINQGEPGTGDGSVPVMTREQLEAQRRTRERATLEVGKEPNRGHGNEGFEDTSNGGPRPGTRAVNPQQKKAEMKEEERKAKLETLTTYVERVTPLLQKLKPAQIAENKKLKAENKPEHEPKPYFAIHCAGEITVYAWNKHTFRAVTSSARKEVVWRISRSKAAEKDFLNLEEIVSQGGFPFVVDPETKDWIPATQLRTQAPSTDDRGESAPVTNGVENREMPSGIPTKEELFPNEKRRV